MRNPMKLLIKRPRPLGMDWTQYVEVGKLLLDNDCSLKTEAQFAHWLFNNWGEGRYQVLAWQKGYEGFWLFWLGNVTESGFMRDKRKNKDVEQLKGKMYIAESQEEKQDLEEEIEMNRELWEMDNRIKRRGPMGIKLSKPGTFHPFEEY